MDWIIRVHHLPCVGHNAPCVALWWEMYNLNLIMRDNLKKTQTRKFVFFQNGRASDLQLINAMQDFFLKQKHWPKGKEIKTPSN